MSLKLTDQISVLKQGGGGSKQYVPLSEINDLISSEESGRLDILETAVLTADTGLVDRVAALEALSQPEIDTADTITEAGEDPTLDITVIKDTFHDDDCETLTNWVWQAGDTELELTAITRTSGEEIEASFTGTAAIGTGVLIALKACFDGDRVESSRLSIAVLPAE